MAIYRYKAKPKFYKVCKGVACNTESINLREERGNTFVTFLNEGRNEGVCDKNIDKVDKVPYLSYNLIAY